MLKFLFPLCLAVTAAIQITEHFPEEPVHYSFFYAVNEPLESDVKHQWQRRTENKIIGAHNYRVGVSKGETYKKAKAVLPRPRCLNIFVEPEEGLRIVDYFANGRNGFRAIVGREGQTFHRFIPSTLPLRIALPSTTRDYFGAIFVKERNYGRGLGYL